MTPGNADSPRAALHESPHESALPTAAMQRILSDLNAGGGWAARVAAGRWRSLEAVVVETHPDQSTTACRVLALTADRVAVEIPVELIAALYATSLAMSIDFPRTSVPGVEAAAVKAGETTIILGVNDADTPAAKRCLEAFHNAARLILDDGHTPFSSALASNGSTASRMTDLARFKAAVDDCGKAYGVDDEAAIRVCLLATSLAVGEALASRQYDDETFRAFAAEFGVDGEFAEWCQTLECGRTAIRACPRTELLESKGELTKAILALYGVMHLRELADRESRSDLLPIRLAKACEIVWEHAALSYQMKRAQLAGWAEAAAHHLQYAELLVIGGMLFDERLIPVERRAAFESIEEQWLRIKRLFELRPAAGVVDLTELDGRSQVSLEAILKWHVVKTPDALALPQSVLETVDQGLSLTIKRAGDLLRGVHQRSSPLRQTHAIVQGGRADNVLGVEMTTTDGIYDVMLVPLTLISLVDLVLQMIESLGEPATSSVYSHHFTQPVQLKLAPAGRPLLIPVAGEDIATLLHSLSGDNGEFRGDALVAALNRQTTTAKRIESLSMVRAALDWRIHTGSFEPTWGRYGDAMFSAFLFLACHELTHSFYGHLDVRRKAKEGGWAALTEREWIWATEIEADAIGAKTALELSRFISSHGGPLRSDEGIMLGVITLLSLTLLQQGCEGNGDYPPAELRLRSISGAVFPGDGTRFAEISADYLRRLEAVAQNTGRPEVMTFGAIFHQLSQTTSDELNYLREARRRYYELQS